MLYSDIIETPADIFLSAWNIWNISCFRSFMEKELISRLQKRSLCYCVEKKHISTFADKSTFVIWCEKPVLLIKKENYIRAEDSWTALSLWHYICRSYIKKKQMKLKSAGKLILFSSTCSFGGCCQRPTRQNQTKQKVVLVVCHQLYFDIISKVPKEKCERKIGADEKLSIVNAKAFTVHRGERLKMSHYICAK